MADRYGYIGIETLLNFCEKSKDHSITPNDIMMLKRMNVEEVYWSEHDTAGNYHWHGTETGHHVI